jgi:lipoprotein-anchoring transpeptidase ErfK/SrfK
VEGVAKVGETLTAKVTPDKATVNYQWMRSDSENEGYAPIEGATEKTYELVAADVGKYIKVRATGTGDYRGTVESEPMGPVVETATFKPVDSIGIHDGKVYEGYKLMAGEDQIDLVASNIESMTVLEPGATEPKTLTVGDDSDPLLWFNVQKATGDYKYTVKTKVGKVYEATIEWTAPASVDAEATGAEGEHDGNYYVEYKLGELDLSSFTKMYQIKPNGEVSELTANTDSNLWFKTNGQVEGSHVFLVKQGETWYTATITYPTEVETATFKPVDSIGIHDGKVYEGYKLMAGEDQIDLVASNIESMTVLEPGATEPKTLTVGDDSDPLLWFNVQKATGDYKYTVVTKAGVTYVATLNWTAPAEVDAVKTGDPAYNQERENWYQLYTVEVDVDPEDSKVYQIKPDGEISELTVLADADNHLNIWFRLYGKDGEQQEGEHIFLIKKGDTWSKAVIDYGLVEVTRADGDVTQDAGKTGGTELSYNFVADGKKLTIDANNTKLPYYETDGSTPPRTANWVGVAIPVPADVDTSEVTATINGVACTDLFFADGKYMEYIDVKDADLTDGAATYEWVISWGAGYADETITIELINVAGLEAPEEEPVEVVRADGDVTQDTGKTGGTELSYNFVADGKKLTIDANNTKLPYYEADGSTPPRTANWVGVAIPVPADVDTSEVTATINGVACTDLFFADGKYMEYIDVKDADLTEGAATYEWIINWGSGYKAETITIELINVAGLEAPEEEPGPTPEEAKAAFMAALADAVENIDVATVGIVNDDITVTFNQPEVADEAFVREVQQVAEQIFASLVEGIDSGRIFFDEDEVGIDLKDTNATEIAAALLDGRLEAALEFLTGEKPLEIDYTANITVLAYSGASIVILRLVALFSVFARSLILFIYVRLNYTYINYKETPNNEALNKRWDALYLQVLGAVHTGAPVIIATIFTSLQMVSVYSIFNMVVAGISGIVGIFTSGLSASFGDVIVRNQQTVLQKAYQEFELMFYALISWAFSCTMVLIMPFIKLYTAGITDVNYNIPLIGFLFTLNGLFYSLKTPQGMLVISAGLYRETRWQVTIQGLIAVVSGVIFCS